jgi:hypothetical protein
MAGGYPMCSAALRAGCRGVREVILRSDQSFERFDDSAVTAGWCKPAPG